MTSDEQHTLTLVRRAAVAIQRDDRATFHSAATELTDLGWRHSNGAITLAVMIAAERIHPLDADVAAAFTRRTTKRFEGTLRLQPLVMEMVVRSAGLRDELALVRGVPRDVRLVHSLVALGQIGYEGYVSMDEVMDQVGAEITAVSDDHRD